MSDTKVQAHQAMADAANEVAREAARVSADASKMAASEQCAAMKEKAHDAMADVKAPTMWPKVRPPTSLTR